MHLIVAPMFYLSDYFRNLCQFRHLGWGVITRTCQEAMREDLAKIPGAQIGVRVAFGVPGAA